MIILLRLCNKVLKILEPSFPCDRGNLEEWGRGENGANGIQKQPFADVFLNRCFEKVGVCSQLERLIKKRLQQSDLSVNIANFLRRVFL